MSGIYWNVSGVIYAGTGTGGSALNQLSAPAGLFLDASDTLYISDSGNFRVVSYLRNASSGVIVAGSGLMGDALNRFAIGMRYLYVDTNGSIYVADANNHRVMRWTNGSSTGVIVAGNGTNGTSFNQLGYPYGIWVDSNFNVYAAEFNNHRVTKWAPGASTGTEVAGVTGTSGKSIVRETLFINL